MNMVRLTAWSGETQIAATEWLPETTNTSAPNYLAMFRKQHPNLAYRIEREGDSKVPNLREVTRATIRLKDDVYYSRWFEANEVDEQMAVIREKWPQADITTETRNV